MEADATFRPWAHFPHSPRGVIRPSVASPNCSSRRPRGKSGSSLAMTPVERPSVRKIPAMFCAEQKCVLPFLIIQMSTVPQRDGDPPESVLGPKRPAMRKPRNEMAVNLLKTNDPGKSLIRAL